MTNVSLNVNPKTTFLITGGAGFIGSHLAEALVGQGYQVRVLDDLSLGTSDNLSSVKNQSNFTFIQGDIRDLETCLSATQGVDYVLHQAAWGSVPRSIAQPLEYEAVNIRGTLNMLEASRINGVQKFVYASSSAVYGDSAQLPKAEGQEGKLLSPYALTKRTSVEYAKLYSALYGLDTVGLRYFNVFGPRQNAQSEYAAVIPKFIQALLHGDAPTIYGDGIQSRDFTYIDNVVRANLLAIQAPKLAEAGVYNVAGGEQVTLNALYQIITDILGITIPAKYGEVRPGDILHSLADISQAKHYLNYSPIVDFRQGIDQTISWYSDQFNKAQMKD